MENQQKSRMRFADNLLESYVKLGSYIGSGLAIGVFVGICSISYWAYYVVNPEHITHGFSDIIIVAATLGVAGVASAVTFFYASVLWLPILFALFVALLLINHTILSFHNLLH